MATQYEDEKDPDPETQPVEMQPIGSPAARRAGAMNERLARFMFDLQADDYDAQGAMRELAWADRNVCGFWLGQSNAVVSFLRLEAA
jgi:hypothetical protein